MNINTPTTVLIVDDDEFDRLSIIRALRKNSGFDIKEASTSQQALELARTQCFELIILDYNLPDLDGINLLKKLRADENRSDKQSPCAIVMISHLDDDRLVIKAIEAGAQDYLLKEEVSARSLIRSIRQARYRYSLETALEKAQNKLLRQAQTDPLTKLPNRSEFERVLQSAVERAKRGSVLALLLLDVDNFKQVNDTFGHAVGDKLLIEVTKRLQNTMREGDFLSRLGGDEFVILQLDLQKDNEAKHLPDRIIRAFNEPIDLGDNKWTVTTSVGIAVYGHCAHNKKDLLKSADIAMYRAKKEGRNRYHFYTKELHESVNEQTELEHQLLEAVSKDQLRIFFQPQINTRDHNLEAVEAVVRWQHPERGLLEPENFLDIADYLGILSAIDDWVMTESCQQFQDWSQRLNSPLKRIAVNLSAPQLRNKRLFDSVQRVIANTEIEPERLELVITENILIQDLENIAENLKKISHLGVRISLSDFGTGFSSFDNFKFLPFSSIKINKQFLEKISCEVKQVKILEAIINFAKTLGLEIVAEGIQTKEQAEICERLKCGLLQGDYFSKALPKIVFEDTFLLSKIETVSKPHRPPQYY
ncbi:GGDEF domain-containing response regulator [Aurantivibrio infirmus]